MIAALCSAIDVRRNAGGRLLIKYSGTLIDEHCGRNIQGALLEQSDSDASRYCRIWEIYRHCIGDRTVCFRRTVLNYHHRIGARLKAAGAVAGAVSQQRRGVRRLRGGYWHLQGRSVAGKKDNKLPYLGLAI